MAKLKWYQFAEIGFLMAIFTFGAFVAGALWYRGVDLFFFLQAII
jgi:hypothetical protein